MDIISILIIIVVVFFFNNFVKKNNDKKENPLGKAKAAEKKAKPASSASRPTLSSRIPTENIRHTAEHKVEAMKYRATHADKGYDERQLDYCDSNLPESGGISFRDIPTGSDELIYLRRYNHQREKELEKELQSRE